MQKRQQPHNPAHSHRVIASLNREQVDFIDKIGKDAQFSSGIKLTRTQILAAMVNALKRLSLNGEGIVNVGQFEQRIVDAMMRNGRRSRREDAGGTRPVNGMTDEEEHG